jgi:hypothetical protein
VGVAEVPALNLEAVAVLVVLELEQDYLLRRELHTQLLLGLEVQ